MNNKPFNPQAMLDFIKERFQKKSFDDLNRKQKRETSKNFSPGTGPGHQKVTCKTKTKRMNPFKPAKHSKYVHKV